MHEALLRLHQEVRGCRPTAVVSIAGDGSQRTYHRLISADGSTLIGAFGPDPDENRAFLSFSRAFRGIGLPVPAIHAADEAAGVWLEDDLGETTLFAALEEARSREGGPFPASAHRLYRRVLDILPRFQVEGDRAVDYGVAHPRAAFDRQSIHWDLNYFKYHFLKLARIPFHEARLERDFAALTDFLLEADATHFLYRDFQSRNVMLRDGEPWFIDYQGGRRGALQYDVASLLYDAKAELPEPVREALLGHYLEALAEHVPVDPAAFRRHFRGFVLVRILQAMGAYGYRGFYERKRHFLLSVPPAIENLERLLATGLLTVPLPELGEVLTRICGEESLRRRPVPTFAGLRVVVGSFSYLRGYPEDAEGHGGGFVFDARALPNPGRDPAFAGLSGLDPEVQEHLARAEGVGEYLAHVRALVERQVAVYRERGFGSLTVQFGCTGGQHRSVYLADRLAAELHGLFPDVRVVVEHAEAARWPETAARRRPASRPVS
jgi:aminoglycoside/choline kinase family phosphotransferase